jgi:hypothetical protein
MADIEDARRIALSVPETSAGENADNGQVGFQVRDKGFAWTYMERVDGQRGRVPRIDVLAVRVPDQEEKAALLASDPDKFFTTAHYNGYPAVLVRLPAVEIDELTELLADAWRCRAPRRLVAAFDAAGRQPPGSSST